MTNSARHEGTRRNYSDVETSYQYSGSIALVIAGDPVVSQALVLLLRSSGYDARFLPDSSLKEPGAMEGVNLLLLTPRPNLSPKDRGAFIASLSSMIETSKIPVLELTTLSGESRGGEVQDESWHPVPWPCRVEKLEQWIEAALAEKSLK